MSGIRIWLDKCKDRPHKQLGLVRFLLTFNVENQY